MIANLVSILSLNVTLLLVQNSVIAGSFPITAATQTTPIIVTCANHRVPLGRVVHGVVTGVTGMTEANGLWVCTPTDANHFSLTTFAADGALTNSVGTNAYVSGGHIQFAFPDYGILLGRRLKALSSATASPRIVFIPTTGMAWDFEPYGGVGQSNDGAPSRGTREVQNATLSPQIATEFTTFEVTVSASAPDYGAASVSPDFADFNATQAVVFALYSVMFDGAGAPRAKVLKEWWPSQLEPNDPRATGSMSQRGQSWCGILQFQQPVTQNPLQYAPIGVTATFDIGTVAGGSSDDAIVVVS